MRIGQIVFISKHPAGLETGIILKKEYEKPNQAWWYEVLCNDGQNHVIPGWLLSLDCMRLERKNKNKKK